MTDHSSLATIILAAGKGTRMKSSRAKVLHEVFYQPMVHHVLNAVKPLRPARAIVIVGHQRAEVEQTLAGYDVDCVEQKEQNGTGHAVLCAEPHLADFSGQVMILCGDSPLLMTRHLEEMYDLHQATGSKLTIITTRLKNPSNYGRILCDEAGNVVAVVEEKDATDPQKMIREINAGIYCVEKEFLFAALKQLTTDNSQGEMYLTDIVAIAVRQGIRVGKYEHPFPVHVLGVNSRIELAQAHREIQARRNNELMASGITMQDPFSTSVAPTAHIGSDCLLCPNVIITGSSTVGSGCCIEPNVFIRDGVVGSNVHIGANSVLVECRIADGRQIAPLTCLNGAE